LRRERPIDRPTVQPPFDPEKYAKDSESQMRALSGMHDDESGIVPVGARTVAELDEPDAHTPAQAVPILMAAIPVLAVSTSELARLALDHRAGFIVSLVDGVSEVEMILDVSAMPADDALAILADLVARGIIILR
jgi:hypothetical protein